jgi:hypothetical protein
MTAHFRFWRVCEVPTEPEIVCFSNRPFGVKHFQTIHHGVDVTRGRCWQRSERECVETPLRADLEPDLAQHSPQ